MAGAPIGSGGRKFLRKVSYNRFGVVIWCRRRNLRDFVKCFLVSLEICWSMYQTRRRGKAIAKSTPKAGESSPAFGVRHLLICARIWAFRWRILSSRFFCAFTGRDRKWIISSPRAGGVCVLPLISTQGIKQKIQLLNCGIHSFFLHIIFRSSGEMCRGWSARCL